ncbi:MAG: hypothetical protein WCN27_06470 [Alphaproteobacteria bacterium]
MFKHVVYFVFLLSLTGECYAYLDPGSGGILIQLLLGGVAGVLGIVKFYWSSIKTKFKAVFSKGKQ